MASAPVMDNDCTDKEVDDHVNLEDDVEERLKAPDVGTRFATMDEARLYYEDYGRQNGFCIRTRSTDKSKSRYSNEVIGVRFVCVNEGDHITQIKKKNIDDVNDDLKSANEEERPKKLSKVTSTIRCECKASMRIKFDNSKGEWIVSVFNNMHNHEIVSPTKRIKLRSNRRMPKAVMNMTELFHKHNIKISKIPEIYGGENIGFDSRRCYNHLRDVRLRDLDSGDANAVATFFKKKQAKNPQFYYAIQSDEKSRMVNFFWVDARSRLAYHSFGDVVSFDTTYRTNKYNMPFAPFIGVNHHMQSIQFGCALLQDETEVTFKWLFETWLEAMEGRHPKSILTDQDLAMKGAIAKVFPNTRHRVCIWHIMKKFGEKLSHVYYKKSLFKKEIKDCIWNTYKKEEFENRWMEIMKKYELENNNWLRQLYDNRESWVPVYNRGTFFAGMNTTGRSERVNAFFNDFVDPTTNLIEFVVRYDDAMIRIIIRERDEDYESQHKFRIVMDGEYLLKDAVQIYTRNIFNKFRVEMNEINFYRIIESNVCGDGTKSFLIGSNRNEVEKFRVILNLQTHEGSCECQNFEFIGILCRHVLKVLHRYDVYTIPAHFVMPRWMKKANKLLKIDCEEGLMQKDDNASAALIFSHIVQESTKLACVATQVSVPTQLSRCYRIIMDSLEDARRKVEDVLSEDVLPEDVPHSSNVAPIVQVDTEAEAVDSSQVDEVSVAHSSQVDEIAIYDPNISQTKGRKRKNSSGRWKSNLELVTEKKRQCKYCKVIGSGHDTRNCPLRKGELENKF